jgi:predicted dehydrogenase
VLQIGIIGCGGFTRNNHVPSLRASPFIRVVAVADVVADNARQVASALDAPHVFADYRALLDRTDVQAVIVAVPNTLHARIAIAAAERGKHVAVEKPMAMTLAEADAMIKAARQHGVTLYVNHNLRYSRLGQTIKAAIDDGEIGEPAYLHLVGLEPPYPTDWQRYRWQYSSELAGGQLVHNGVHPVDLALWFMGDRPEVVYAQGQKVTSPHLDYYDYNHITLGFPRGQAAMIELSKAGSRDPYDRVLLLGTAGRIMYDIAETAAFVMPADRPALPGGELTFWNVRDWGRRQKRDWYEYVVNGRPPRVSAEDARAGLAVVLAAQRSIDTGQAVRLAEGGE